MHTKGVIGELIAIELLKRRGFQILERHFCVRGGELDVIALEGSALVFVEVKTRGSKAFGKGIEALGPRKRRALARAMHEFLQKKGAWITYRSMRLDVIDLALNLHTRKILSVTHYKNVPLLL